MIKESSQKKICFLVGYYPIWRGGAEFQSLLIAKSLQKDFDVIFISTSYTEEKVFHEDGFKIYTLKPLKLPGFQPVYKFQFKKILNILKAEAPDVIYHRALSANIYPAAVYCKNHPCKLFWHIAIILDLYIDKLFAWNKNLMIRMLEYYDLKRGIEGANVIFAQTNEQKSILKQRFGRDAIQVYNFHETAKVKPVKSLEKIVILWVANLKEKKRPYLFIELAKLLSGYRNVEFIMMGRAGSKEYSKEAINQVISGESNISYIGEVSIDKVNELLSSSHLLINTSDYEGFSNTFVQAFMHSVPVITLHSDPDGILMNQGLGYRVDTFENLVDKVKFLIENPTVLLEMGSKAEDFAGKNLGMGNIDVIKAAFIESIYGKKN